MSCNAEANDISTKTYIRIHRNTEVQTCSWKILKYVAAESMTLNIYKPSLHRCVRKRIKRIRREAGKMKEGTKEKEKKKRKQREQTKRAKRRKINKREKEKRERRERKGNE